MLAKALKLTAIGVCALLPLSSHANNFNYNMLEFRMGTSPGTFGGEFTTYFTENTHFIIRGDTEFNSDWDVAGGIGFNGPAGQFADIFGQMLVHNINEEVVEQYSSYYDNNWRAEVNLGTRMWLMQDIEVHAQFGQLIANDGNATTYSLGGRFHSTQQLSLGLEVRNTGVYGSQVAMAARFSF
ncbi:MULTISPECIES: hypothetical protein [Vibrio]|jgi:uncharacterized protein affecting Mg2+/Co2+ transport|uniref:Outer membrane protein beta-barrel domain-containing protein n=1 Tax=Vibrio rotiferianus TaxID=190895 RepID=A0ABX3D7F3_9VIBR|nr:MULTISPECIES: hypothetical protein [Vibrio]MDK9775857.1 hypothetical protein [Vibrio sp. D401a]MDK9802934.1 hypothetical protein [Vibrio sp. D406a]OHY92364.1 hypothetical protein BI375_20515 [Vibrio rotiferianus]PIB12431.1 hypothetical protein B853_22506 [Vibrio rotiferianus CAIM 577 = LMG 21460]USD52356.1 hypothetical protein J4N37_24790 [Vibrio sp. SCSIO 43153]